jgi:hypothetical protein
MSEFSFLPDDQDKLQQNMGAVAPGKGMAIIESFSMYTGGRGSNANTQHELKIEIIAWSDKSSEGSFFTEGIWTADKEPEKSDKKKNYAAQIAVLVCASGLMKLSDLKRMSMAQIDDDKFYAKLVGRPIMVEIAARAKKDDPTKIYHNIAQYGRAIFHMKDPRCKDWPMDRDIYNQYAHIVGDWVAAKTEKPAPAKTAPAAAAAGVDPFAAMG